MELWVWANLRQSLGAQAAVAADAAAHKLWLAPGSSLSRDDSPVTLSQRFYTQTRAREMSWAQVTLTLTLTVVKLGAS